MASRASLEGGRAESLQAYEDVYEGDYGSASADFEGDGEEILDAEAERLCRRVESVNAQEEI